MRRVAVFFLFASCAAVLCATSCRHKPKNTVTPDDGDYPASVSAIILSKCAISGCHNQASYQNAAGLLLDNWTHLFQGSIYGAEVVAYNAKYSPVLSYLNNGYDSTIVAINDVGHLPKPLSAAEYDTIKSWILRGAPDKNGYIPFATNADTRQKIYLTVSGCNNLIAVIDAQSRVIMRYIPVGTYYGNEAIHDVEVSSDGNYAYVSFYSGRLLQKIDTRTDTVVGTVDLSSLVLGGLGNWSIIQLSPQDTALLVSGMIANGAVVAVNTANMQVESNLSIDQHTTGSSSPLIQPHGIAANPTFDTFFTTLEYGNIVASYTFNSPSGFRYRYISINGQPPTPTQNVTTPDPHQILMAPDFSRYFVTCQNTNEVRVIDAHTGAVLDSIPVGTKPQEMALSESKHYLFVVCMEDAATTVPGARGSVYVIDYTTMKVVKVIYGDFYQPHEAAVDEQDGLVFINSTDVSSTGPAPHHVSNCGLRNGWYSVYDLNTLSTDGKRYETGVNPYSIATRFK